MSNTQLSDIIDVTVFQDLPSQVSPEKTAFFESGIAAASPLFDELANSSGKTQEMPFWNDLDSDSEPNTSTSDAADVADTDKITQGEQIARKAFLNKGWSASDLASEIAMGDRAMDAIRAKTDTYWLRQWQRRLIASCDGILESNVANDDGDMVHDVASDSIAGATTDTGFTRQNFIEAAFTLGDKADGVRGIAVHSNVKKQMVSQNDVEDVHDKDGVLLFQKYMGARIIVDDQMTVVAGGTDGFKYRSVLFGTGAFGFGNGTPDVPVEVARSANLGNGGGIEALWTRKTWLLHPAGFQSVGTPSGESFSLAELRAAGSWTRALERKSIPLAFLVTN